MFTLTSLGVTPGQAVELLTDPAIIAAQSDIGLLDGIFDASDRLEGGGVVIWWNDLEKDNRCVPSVFSLLTMLTFNTSYSRWGPSLFGVSSPS
jgi:hypothetical protein